MPSIFDENTATTVFPLCVVPTFSVEAVVLSGELKPTNSPGEYSFLTVP